ncbi:MAG: tRNA (adenosine(37)-N6)-threonylcarbamoyltransferase complex ATPase subunit type 1 TsaE [Bacillota bacterium]
MKQLILNKFTKSAVETFEIGADFAKNLTCDEVIFMYGEAGAGKTVFTKGLSKTLGISEEILSPTFALVNIYESGKFPLYHFDMYRISSEEEAYEAGLLDMLYGGGIKVIEWSENIREYLDISVFYTVEIFYREGGREINIYKEQA